MKNSKNLWLCAILMLTFAAVFSSCDDSLKDSSSNAQHSSLYAVARQGADAPIQYKSEMPLFSLENIKSFNTETGELILQDFVLDTHLFHDIGYRYRVYFYDGNDLLFDARPVSWFSSAAYFNDLTFQCDVYGPDEMWDASKSHFYIRYGYPGTIQGDETVEELKKKNEKGMNHFINILSQSGKIVNGLSNVSHSECGNRSSRTRAEDENGYERKLKLTYNAEDGIITGEYINYILSCDYTDAGINIEQDADGTLVLNPWNEAQNVINCICHINIYFTIPNVTRDNFHLVLNRRIVTVVDADGSKHQETWTDYDGYISFKDQSVVTIDLK